MMLTASPKSWWSWDFSLKTSPAEKPVAEVHLSSWRERGSIIVKDTTYRVHRDGLSGPFILEAPDGSTVASATKPSVLRREFVVANDEQRYVLKALAVFRRECGLFRGDRRIGSIIPHSALRRRARVQFEDGAPLLLQAFVVWLAMLLWQRDSSG